MTIFPQDNTKKQSHSIVLKINKKKCSVKREELRLVEDIIEGLNERRDSRWKIKKAFSVKGGWK